MVRSLSLDDLLAVSEGAMAAQPHVRDWGLLDSALARPKAPKAVVFGEHVSPAVLTKAAALVYCLARDHALVDGNKPTAFGALWLFLAMNGFHLIGTDDERRAVMLDVATGELNDVTAMGERLRYLTEPM